MTKFHVNDKGNAEACNAGKGANPRGCPFGGEADHYPTKEEAQVSYEAKKDTLPKAKSNLDKRAEKYEPKVLREMPDAETLKNALAYSKVHNMFAKVYVKTETAALPNYIDDVYYISVQQEETVIATPYGFVRSKYVAYLDHNSSEKFFAEVSSYGKYYSSVQDLLDPEKNKYENQVSLDEVDEFLRKNFDGSKNLNYDYYDVKSASDASVRALKELGDHYNNARLVTLTNYEGKIAPEVLASDNYLGSKNYRVRTAVVSRKEFPKSAHDIALQDKSDSVVRALAMRPDLDKETMKSILDNPRFATGRIQWYDNRNPRAALLSQAKIPVSMQNNVVKTGSFQDFSALLKNPHLSSKNRVVLEEMKNRLKF